MKFYNREKEIEKLLQIQIKSTKNAQFTVLTGRRRIGKTQLMIKTFQHNTVLYFFVAKKSETLLCKDFQKELNEKLQIPVLGEVQSFAVLFEYILQLAQNKNITLIIDEFQEFFSVNASVYSDMQRIWDLYHTKSKINLIVSGSVFSLMHKIFQNNKEPLFGRAQNFIHLKAFDSETIKTILNDHNPGYKPDDLLALFSFTGGVAKYIQLLMDNGACNKNKMISYMIAEDSVFLHEGKSTLLEEFGKDYAIYFSILTCIAEGKNSRSQIESVLKKEVGGYLTKMEYDYQLIKKATPMFRESKTKQVRYILEDNFLLFWFRFIYKYTHIIEIGAYNQLQKIIRRDYETYSGTMLEKYFRTKAAESKNYTAIGGYWDRKGETGIDFIAVNEVEKKLAVAEIKRNKNKNSINKLQQKMGRLLAIYPALEDYETRYFAWSLDDM
ncbi:MAG: ATP-binding protein [Bacteroidota bacterium]